MSLTLTQLAYQAARDLGCLRSGMGLGADLLNDIKDAANQMLNAWLIDELMVIASPATIFNLTAGTQFYTIGPSEVAPNFTGDRPTQIEEANIIINTVSPVIRQPLDLYNVQQWANVRVVDIPFAVPLKLYYEGGFNTTTGSARMLFWPGPLSSYQVEIFTWDQSVLRQFSDLTTPFIYPPGYERLIRKNLAVEIAPLMMMYSQGARVDQPLQPSQANLALVMKQAQEAKDAIYLANENDQILTGDPAWMGTGRGRSGWNYLLGTVSRSGN